MNWPVEQKGHCPEYDLKDRWRHQELATHDRDRELQAHATIPVFVHKVAGPDKRGVSTRRSVCDVTMHALPDHAGAART
jgi:hypothetical protein